VEPERTLLSLIIEFSNYNGFVSPKLRCFKIYSIFEIEAYFARQGMTNFLLKLSFLQVFVSFFVLESKSGTGRKTGVNFINILHANFAPKCLRQKLQS